MAGRVRMKRTFVVFGKRKRGFSSPQAAAKSLMRTYLETATGRVGTGKKRAQLDFPIADMTTKTSLSASFGATTRDVTILPDPTKLGKDKIETVFKGVRAVRRILASPKELGQIMEEAFRNTVQQELKRRWTGAGGTSDLGKQTRSRGGGTNVNRRAATSDVIKKRTAEFKEGAKEIQDLLTETLIVRQNFVGLASLQEFTNIEVSSSPSKLRSIFLMLEFGTGRYAKPASLIRTKGRWKVPNRVAKLEDGVTTADWFNLGWVRELSDKFKKKTKKQEEKGLLNLSFKWAANPGRVGRHIIFQERGIAASLVKAKRKAFREVIRILNNQVQQLHPGWGSVTLLKVNIPLSTAVTLTL